MLEIGIGAIIVSLIAGAMGFTGLSEGAAVVAKVVFGIFLVLALLIFLMVVMGVQLFT
jgi:uncharacterized membrane protein YtjA (UPF0391 family)